MVIKRRRKQTKLDNTNKKIQLSGPSISDLPNAIFTDILLKLSTKSITLCKCVCKTWHSVISDPEFAKLHLAQAKTCFLIRDMDRHRISRALYLLEPEDGYGFEDWYCWCGECDRCRLNKKVKAKLKIPLRNNAQVLFSHAADDANAIFHPESKRNRKHLVELNSGIDHRYEIVNSCNGLLCLTEPLGNKSCSVVVCNPVAGEFIHLPESCYDGIDSTDVVMGLGFSPKNNQYKVIRMFAQRLKESLDFHARRYYKKVEIHTLGTDSWRSFGISDFNINLLHSVTYLNGALHWILRENNKDSRCIVSFDLDEERFHSHHVPSLPCARRICYDFEMGVLGGCLCLYTPFAYHHICIWVMENYGVWESWTKLFSIDLDDHPRSPSFSLCRPIIYLNNGVLVMFSSNWNHLLYFDGLGGLRFKSFKFRGFTSKFEAITHTPSFISLKDIVKTGNAEVFNVNSRCGILQLVEETFPLFLGGPRKQ